MLFKLQDRVGSDILDNMIDPAIVLKDKMEHNREKLVTKFLMDSGIPEKVVLSRRVLAEYLGNNCLTVERQINYHRQGPKNHEDWVISHARTGETILKATMSWEVSAEGLSMELVYQTFLKIKLDKQEKLCYSGHRKVNNSDKRWSSRLLYRNTYGAQDNRVSRC